MRGPVVIRSQADVTVLVLLLVIVAQRIAAGFRRRLIEPATRQDAPDGLDALRRGARSLIRDRLGLKTGVLQVSFIGLPGNDVMVQSVVRENAKGLFVASTT